MRTTRKTGWIGADIGNSTVKVVQVERAKGGLRLAASAIVPRRNCWSADGSYDDETLSSADEFSSVRSLRAGFRGRRVAAALPMSLCDVHVLDRPFAELQGDDRDTLKTIETVTQRPVHDLQYAAWAAEPPADEGQLSRTNLISVASSWTDQLCTDVAKTGWSCQAIDALPFCLARAVAMAEDKAPTTAPTAALDLGYRRATFCVVVDGRPVYVRCLKDCSLQGLLDALIDNLNVDREEAQRLLSEHGVFAAANEGASNATAVIRELTAEPLRQLAAEIERTISHLNGQRRSIVPNLIYLFGGGGAIKGISEHLKCHLPADVRVWRFEGPRPDSCEPSRVPSCLFGPAIALSALAWEQA